MVFEINILDLRQFFLTEYPHEKNALRWVKYVLQEWITLSI